ncbi:hypothetical protein ACVWXU_000755 [Streptomyces sp. TE33382]
MSSPRGRGQVGAHPCVEGRPACGVLGQVLPERAAELYGEGGLSGADAVQELDEGEFGAADGSLDVQHGVQACRVVRAERFADSGQGVAAGPVPVQHSPGGQVSQHPVERAGVRVGEFGQFRRRSRTFRDVVGDPQGRGDTYRHRGRQVRHGPEPGARLVLARQHVLLGHDAPRRTDSIMFASHRSNRRVGVRRAASPSVRWLLPPGRVAVTEPRLRQGATLLRRSGEGWLPHVARPDRAQTYRARPGRRYRGPGRGH